MTIILGLLFFDSAGDSRPVCTAKSAGELWPAQANGDPRLAQCLARDGNLEICGKATGRFRWTSPSIHINELRRASLVKKKWLNEAARKIAGLN